MKEEKNPIELLLDENNSENIILFDSQDRETEFEQIALIPIEEKIYAILKPVSKIEEIDIKDNEALVFVIEDINGEECLRMCQDEEDDKVIDTVFEQYYELLKSEGFEV